VSCYKQTKRDTNIPTSLNVQTNINVDSSLPMCLGIGVHPQHQTMPAPVPADDLCFAHSTHIAANTDASVVTNAAPLKKHALETAMAEENARSTSMTMEHPSSMERWLSTLPTPSLEVQSPLTALASLPSAPPRSDSPAESMESVLSSSHPVYRPAPVQGVPVLRKAVPVRAQSMRAKFCWASNASDTSSNRPPVERTATGVQFEDFLSRDKISTSHQQNSAKSQHHHGRRASALAAEGLKTIGKQAVKQVTKVAERVDHVVTEITTARHGHT
jgi:hypothetical protein